MTMYVVLGLFFFCPRCSVASIMASIVASRVCNEFMQAKRLRPEVVMQIRGSVDVAGFGLAVA